MARGEGRSRRRTAMRIALAGVMAVIGLLLYNRIWGDGGSGDGGAPAPVDGLQDAPADAGVDEDAVTTTFADAGAPVDPTCPAADGSSPRRVNFSEPPPMCLDPAKTYVAIVETTRGDFEITLDSESAPLATNNFAFLAGWHYYEGVAFHRIIGEFVVQGGDAVGPVAGYGGPGYAFADEPPTEQPFYPLMSVAMANSGPNTNGSQFFIVIGSQGEQLQPNFTRFGGVTAGVPVVEDIAATADPQSRQGIPTELTVIEKITVLER